jgi:predicted transcriptional regulator
MAKLEDVLQQRPVNRKIVEKHKKRMAQEMEMWRLREIREQFHITQVQLAQALDVSQNRISNLERGELDRSQIDTLRKYVEALGGTLHIEARIGDEVFSLS